MYGKKQNVKTLFFCSDGTSAGAIVRQQAAAIGSDPTRIQPQASQPQLDQQRLAGVFFSLYLSCHTHKRAGSVQ